MKEVRADKVTGRVQTLAAFVALPKPHMDGHVSVERALLQRRSFRDFVARSITLADIGQLLWAAQGITHEGGRRTAPSAGALYPLSTYVAAGDVRGLSAGIYRYAPHRQALNFVVIDDRRPMLATAALDQEWIARAAAVLIITADYGVTTEKYGERGVQYVHIEAGHAAQNICLQAETFGLGATVVGAFDERRIRDVLELPEEEDPLLLIPVGHHSS
jgi:SagB-type dehydrogenase family enzyme